MSIQKNFNDAMANIAITAAAIKIYESIKKLGFNDANELQKAINELSLSIADCKDKNIDCTNKEKLLKKYKKIKAEYDEQLMIEEEKRKKNSTIAIIVLVIFFLILIIITCSLFEQVK